MKKFQLTRLMRGVTLCIFSLCLVLNISTHTPHARRDEGVAEAMAQQWDFNSHASCEA